MESDTKYTGNNTSRGFTVTKKIDEAVFTRTFLTFSIRQGDRELEEKCLELFVRTLGLTPFSSTPLHCKLTPLLFES